MKALPSVTVLLEDLRSTQRNCGRADLSALEESYLDVLGSGDQSVP